MHGFFWVGKVDTGVWTQGLHLEPLYQPFSVMVFFWDRVLRTIHPGWLQTSILLISASWVVRITGTSHRCPSDALLITTLCEEPHKPALLPFAGVLRVNLHDRQSLLSWKPQRWDEARGRYRVNIPNYPAGSRESWDIHAFHFFSMLGSNPGSHAC
jgi:hypothetical protein